VPDDFDAFGARAEKQLAAVPLEPQVYSRDQPGMKDDLDCFDVQIKCLGDAPVFGLLRSADDAKPKVCRRFCGFTAGVRSSAAAMALQGAKHGMLSLDINAHGIPTASRTVLSGTHEWAD